MDRKIIGNITICLLFFGAGLVFLQKLYEAENVVTLLKPPVTPTDAAVYMADSLVLEDYELLFGQVGHKVDAAFVLYNKSDMDVRNITIYCTLHDVDGKQWSDSTWRIYSRIPPNGTGKYTFSDKRYISHKALSHKSYCQIIDLVPADQKILLSSVDKESTHSSDH